MRQVFSLFTRPMIFCVIVIDVFVIYLLCCRRIAVEHGKIPRRITRKLEPSARAHTITIPTISLSSSMIN